MATPGRSRVRFQEPPESARKDRSFELQEDPSFWKDNSVQVVIRVRPLNDSEISTQGQSKCVRQDSCQSITWTGNPETRFTFDHVAEKDVTQEKLFKVAGVPMVDNCVDGYNSCMFAYGQTGSGKTYTMLGDIEGGTRRHSIHAGMTPRVFEYLFSRIQKEKEARRDEKLRFTCKCSFLEIYNEHILDLLDPSSVNLQIREDIRRGVYVENLTEFEVSSARDIIQHLVQGSTNRKVASTNMNRASSRSHSVFTCVIESKWEVQGVTHHRFAHLHLVDLAGSERQKSSGAEGERLKEATNINKSLSTLGLVIMNLVAYGNKKALHIPYRDSKLTFLLQDSLGGNSKTIIIANISPSNCSSLETLSTLKFAQRAKHIRNNAIVNEDASGDVLAMRSEIQQLKKELSLLKGLNNVGLVNQGIDNSNGPFLGSPEIFKWHDGHGSFSPLTLDKRLSQGKESQAALFASLLREQDKDKIINALLAEKQTAEKMVSQRTEEVQALKMRLRLREDQIKRLEAGATGALPSDASLLQERDELLKEIEILRNQLERNPQITRFAMEALQLKEKLRRVQSLVGEGQQEKLTTMSEEITVLRDKLLEALEWKMMHEKDAAIVQNLSTSRDSSVEENEFLRMQAIHYEKNLLLCLESKEKLQRRVDELVSQVEELNAMKVVNVAGEAEEIAATNSVHSDDQMELRTLVEAISAASQREAEAHETAITLANENEELQAKLRASIEDKNKMTKYYESIIGESSKCAHRDGSLFVGNLPVICAARENNCVDDDHEAMTRKLEQLETQLADMHEENDKLMGLYEQAMQERGEFKRLLHCSDQKDLKKADINCSVDIPEAANTERSYFILGSTLCGLDELTNRIEVVKDLIHLKQSEVADIKVLGSQIQEKKLVNEKKLLASRFSCRALFSNEKLQYWQARQKCAQSKVAACVKFLEDKKEEMEVLKSSKREVDIALLTSRELEAKSKDKIKCIKQKIEEAENRQKEVEKVLFTIENLEKEDVPAQRNCNLGKASELLKTQEEKAKLVAEMKLQENMISLKKDVLRNEKKSQSLDIKIRNLESEIASASASLQKGKSALQKSTLEIETLNQMTKDVKENNENLLVDYQEILFQLELKEAESNLLAEELQQEKVHLKQLKYEQRMVIQNLIILVGEK